MTTVNAIVDATPNAVSGSQPATSTTTTRTANARLPTSDADTDAPDVRQTRGGVQRDAVADERRTRDPFGRGGQTGQPRQRIGGHGDEQTERRAQGGVGTQRETQ